MSAKKAKKENYLDKKPRIKSGLVWKTEEDGKVVFEIENKGLFNKVAQKLLKKPKISYIHLDKTGSFIWKNIDGEKTVLELGELLKNEFGEECEPLYERLAQYIGILENNGFIT